MHLAEIAEHILRPDLDRTGAPGMQPGRAARDDLKCLHRRAGSGEHRKRIGLGVEQFSLRRTRPVAAETLRRRKAAADAARGHELILRTVALEHLPDLEQRDVAKAAIGI